jgi:hypothetical protein
MNKLRASLSGNHVYPEGLGGIGEAFSTVGGEFAESYRTSLQGYQSLDNVPGQLAGRGAELNEQLEGVKDELERLAALAKEGAGPSVLEQILGTPEQINAQTEAIKVAHEVFAGFAQAAGQAFEAIVYGGEASAKSIKKAIAEVLKALSIEMFVRSLTELAMGIALSFINPAAAGSHYAASAAFAVAGGAATAGALALGAGSAGAATTGMGASPSSAGSFLPASGGNGGGSVTNIINLASDWDDQTPTERRQRLARAVRKGNVSRTANIVGHH